jgi:TPR repeat protein
MAEIKGELGLSGRQKEGFKWLKRAAELADQPDCPPSSIEALYELGLLHVKGIEHVVFVDADYAAECWAKASELGHAKAAFTLGECYEYGRMRCPQDSALSIHYYSACCGRSYVSEPVCVDIAAQQGHPEACFALTAWYLIGSPGVLPQSDTEAYLWAKKAAAHGLPKAEFAVGYFSEVRVSRPFCRLVLKCCTDRSRYTERSDGSHDLVSQGR